jgi:gluconokinase
LSTPIVIMGVSGSGKSTLGSALALRLGWRFVEGDALHPPRNVAKMTAGEPLTDADRWPWLERVAEAIVAGGDAGVVLACSALKRSYRDFLRDRAGAIMFVLPSLQKDVLTARVAARPGHYMPASLLQSQLDALEALAPDECSTSLDGTLALELQLSQLLQRLNTTLR